GLSPDQSAAAMITGFRETANPGAELRICVLDQEALHDLRPVVDGLVAIPPDGVGPGAPVTGQLRGALPPFDGPTLTAGALAGGVTRPLAAPEDPLSPDDILPAGPLRTLDGHLDEVRRRCPGLEPIGVARLLVGLALDAGVGRPLLESGVVEGL